MSSPTSRFCDLSDRFSNRCPRRPWGEDRGRSGIYSGFLINTIRTACETADGGNVLAAEHVWSDER
jgi:hypothetical protein